MNVYETLIEVFSRRKRPEHFTNFNHCDDCKEFDEILRSFTRENITFKELGNIAWNPISDATINGFFYYFPALSRLALGKGSEYFIDQFLIHVDNQDRLDNMSNEERQVFKDYLIWLQTEMKDELDENLDGEDLEEFINRLK